MSAATATRIPPDACPGCGAIVDGTTDTGHGHKPRPGDVTLCFYCGAANQFGPDFRLRPFDEGQLNADEAAELAGVRSMIAEARARGPS